jgi:hypothetical protein
VLLLLLTLPLHVFLTAPSAADGGCCDVPHGACAYGGARGADGSAGQSPRLAALLLLLPAVPVQCLLVV